MKSNRTIEYRLLNIASVYKKSEFINRRHLVKLKAKSTSRERKEIKEIKDIRDSPLEEKGFSQTKQQEPKK